MTERDLQEKFVSWLKKESDWSIYQEVDTYYYGMVDVLEYLTCGSMVSYELKLKDYKKVIEQAFERRLFSARIYIVMPDVKLHLINKFTKGTQYDYIGIINFDTKKQEFEIIKKPKNVVTSERTKNCRVNVMDRIIRGFHLEGARARKSYR